MEDVLKKLNEVLESLRKELNEEKKFNDEMSYYLEQVGYDLYKNACSLKEIQSNYGVDSCVEMRF